MAFQIVWTPKAIAGYDRIINYLRENWTEKEIINFVTETERFLEVLVKYLQILQQTNKHKNLYRGSINRLTILTYHIKTKTKQIELINIRGARQKPLVK